MAETKRQMHLLHLLKNRGNIFLYYFSFFLIAKWWRNNKKGIPGYEKVINISERKIVAIYVSHSIFWGGSTESNSQKNNYSPGGLISNNNDATNFFPITFEPLQKSMGQRETPSI